MAAVLLLLTVPWFRFDMPPLNNAFALTLLAVFIFFNSRREEIQQAVTEQEDDTVFGYDFSQGYTSLERDFEDEEDHQPEPSESKRSLLGMWLQKRREAQDQRCDRYSPASVRSSRNYPAAGRRCARQQRQPGSGRDFSR